MIIKRSIITNATEIVEVEKCTDQGLVMFKSMVNSELIQNLEMPMPTLHFFKFLLIFPGHYHLLPQYLGLFHDWGNCQ